MVLLPGCSCCGTGPCKPCPNCAPPCVALTFSGFSSDTGNCNECDFLDDMTFVLKRHDTEPFVGAKVTDPTGTGAVLSAALAQNIDKSWQVTKVTVNNGGGGYTNPTLSTSVSGGIECRAAQGTISLKTGQPTSGLTISAAQGTGASIGANTAWSPITLENGTQAFTITKLGSAPWVDNRYGGSGYAVGATATLTNGNNYFGSPDPNLVTVEAATVRIDGTRRFPARPAVGTLNTSTGTGAVWTLQDQWTLFYGWSGHIGFEETTDEDGKTAWTISSLPVPTNGGSGYSSSDTITFSFPASSDAGPFAQAYTPTVIRQPQVTVQVDGSGTITGYNIVDGGLFYNTDGQPNAITLLAGGKYYKAGVIDAVTITDGGEYWPSNSCSYTSDGVCSVCPADYGNTLSASLSIGADSNSVSVYRNTPGGAVTILTATQSSVDDNGNPIGCDGFKFKAESVSSKYRCINNGTISVASGDCSQKSVGHGCDFPEQITLSCSGIPLVFSHGSSYGAGLSGALLVGLAEQCDITSYCTVSESTGGGGNSWRAGLISRDESGVVLDRDQQPGQCAISYSGLMPTLPFAGGQVFSGNSTYSCGGELEARGASLTILPIKADTHVSISPPSWGSFGAEAEATISGKAITKISVLNGGEGYAREIIHHDQPELTASASGGTGAELSITLSGGTGDPRTRSWGVGSISVTKAGSGYSDYSQVTIGKASDDFTESGAYAYVRTGRSEPTVTATATGGSGADLSVSLTKVEDYDWYSNSYQTYWSVQSVAVNDGGTGYSDGTSVTFTPTAGVVYLNRGPAQAVIRTHRSEPTVTAAATSGTGATLSVTLTSNGDTPETWSLSGVGVTSGGTGYTDYEAVNFSADAGDTVNTAAAAVVRTDENGVIQSVEIQDAGSYHRADDVIESVEMQSPGWWSPPGGGYYLDDGVISSVTVDSPGAYWKVNHTGQADADTPTVTISSNVGEGATATATVDSKVGSETFGTITGITVNNGGHDYESGEDRWQATLAYDGLGHAGVSDRISSQPCPTDLLNRSYSMFFSARSAPQFFGSGCRQPDSVTNGSNVSFYRWNGITISVAGG